MVICFDTNQLKVTSYCVSDYLAVLYSTVVG